ncbi:MAG: hypothetical protein OXG25_09075 [Gammaproteobacteria bacterium]|nr:hypothetical protein [Gammaproteobacteria bacterium]
MTRSWCIALIAIMVTLSGCASEPDSPRSSVLRPRSPDTQATQSNDAIETHEDRQSPSIAQEETSDGATVGGTVPRVEDEAEGDQGTSETLESSQAAEVDGAEPWRPSIRLPSKVWLLDSETLPERPFEGIVQLRWSADSRSDDSSSTSYTSEGWQLWFYQYEHSGVRAGWNVGYVPLSDLAVDCVGDVGLVSRGVDGVEVGGSPGSVNASFLVPWGGTPRRLDVPSQELLEEIALRPSNVTVAVVGDFLHVGEGDSQVRYLLREPARPDGEWWEVQARHDGEVFVMTVHPARHECFSGVTWLSVAVSGELLACGADTAATRYLNSEGRPAGRLELPVTNELPQYLECAFPLSHHSLR